MKAVLSNRIYMNVEGSQSREIREQLTHTIPAMHPNQSNEIICDVATIKTGIISIPIGAQHLVPKHYEIVDKRTIKEANLKSNIVELLRPSQKEIYDKVTDNCIINAKPGWGKTFTALAVAQKLGQKTLIVTHTVFLRDQWEEEVKTLFGFKPGIIGSGVYQIDTPIVLANIQTLSKKMDLVKAIFGTLIIDECHHVPATTFKNVLDKSKARYKIGLSGTVKRKDRKHVLMPDYLSSRIYSPPKENVMTPTIHTITSQIPLESNPMIPWAKKINKLKDMPAYQKLILNIVKVYSDLGHKVLVLSDRVQFLEKLHELTPKSICITGTTKNRDGLIEKVYTDEVNIIFGSISIFKEGISINILSCLVLGTPVNNAPLMEQLIGRIIREYPGKLNPIVVDVILKGTTAKNQANERLSLYVDHGYKIKSL
jgi:superfamily II DNA or RNA helicase